MWALECMGSAVVVHSLNCSAASETLPLQPGIKLVSLALQGVLLTLNREIPQVYIFNKKKNDYKLDRQYINKSINHLSESHSHTFRIFFSLSAAVLVVQ